MLTHRVIALATAIGLACSLGGPAVRPAAAGADVCPEPNSDRAAACFLGASAVAPGFLDTPEDVDTYRIELAPDAMIVATLGGLSADYGLRLQMPDGSVKAEAIEPGLSDKVVRADGLAPGTYFLAVYSPRGESSAEQPYQVSVSYPASLVLGTPAAPTAPGGAAPVPYGYVPAPAKAYGLLPSDVGAGFREIVQEATEDGRGFANRIVVPDAVSVQGLWISRSDIWLVDTVVGIQPYGSNDDLGAEYNGMLNTLRGKYGANVQPAVGWGSEQVYSYAWAGRSADGSVVIMYCGVALKHRNAVVLVEMIGLEQHATWDKLSGLVRTIESRIQAAAQQYP